MQIKTKVEGIDLSASMIEKSLRIENVITRRIDTCSLIIEDTTESITVSEQDELIISNTGETVRYFAGFISKIGIDMMGRMKRYVCRAQDYTVLLDRVIVNEVYEDKTDAFILNDICTSYLAEVDGSTYVAAVKTYDRIVFNRIKLREVIDMLAGNAGVDWYLDYNKKLHFFAKETNLAPFGISDAPDMSATYPCSQLTYDREISDIVNRVLVIGGTYYSPDTDFELPANNQTTEFLMPYKMHAPDGQTSILVYKNSGTDEEPVWGDALGIGIDYIDTLGDPIFVLHNYQEKLLKFDSAPPGLNRAIKITARYDVPVLVRVRSEVSHDTYGRWFDGKVVNQDINSRDWAKLEGKAVLAKHALVKESGTFRCITDGLAAGQLLSLVNSDRGLDGNYLINKVVTRLLGGTHCEYVVSYGEYNPDLVDMIIANKARATQFRESRLDEVLNELLEQAESLTLVEATSEWQQAKGQYCWAPKSNGGSLREAVWDFFTWG